MMHESLNVFCGKALSCLLVSQSHYNLSKSFVAISGYLPRIIAHERSGDPSIPPVHQESRSKGPSISAHSLSGSRPRDVGSLHGFHDLIRLIDTTENIGGRGL